MQHYLAIAALSSTLAAQSTPPATSLESPHPVPTSCKEGAWDESFNHDTTGFSQQPFLNRFNAVHLSLIPVGPHRGDVLVWDFETEHDPAATQNTGSWFQRWAIVSLPEAGHHEEPGFWNFDLLLPACRGDLFCAGHVWDAQGRLFVAGGTSGYGSYGPGFTPPPAPNYANQITPIPCHPKFPLSSGGRLAYYWDPLDPYAKDWTRLPDLERERYYPSVNLLPDGRLLVSGGGPTPSLFTYDNSYEVFDPTTMQWEDNGGTQVFPGPQYPDGRNPLMLYPRLHPLTTGELFLSSMTGWTARLNHAVAPGVWQITGRTSWDYRIYGNAALLPNDYDGPNQVMIVGGNVLSGFPPNPYVVHGATDVVEQCNAAGNAKQWSFNVKAPINEAREYSCLVTLPNGSLLLTAGRSTGPNWQGGPFIDTMELYTPETLTWRELTPPDHHVTGHGDSASTDDGPEQGPRHSPEHGTGLFRGYHQTALLLPDGRVLIGGANVRNSDYDIYVPPYLACGQQRPTIVNAPTRLTYSQLFTIEHEGMKHGRTVERAVLMAPGSTTHHYDFSARHVSLTRIGAQGNVIQFASPKTPNHANPGYYMLFLLSDQGTPSVATWVELR